VPYIVPGAAQGSHRSIGQHGPRSRCFTDEVPLRHRRRLVRRTALWAPSHHQITNGHQCPLWARKEAIGVVGDPYGPLGGLQVFRLVERLSQLDRALFVVAPAHDRIRLT
jgi:hypothetical protein